MSVLDEINAKVLAALPAEMAAEPDLAQRLASVPPAIDPLPFLRSEKISVIAEVKRSSPSKGALAEIADPAELATIYQSGGAKAISVLTQKEKFHGSLEDLIKVRKAVSLPILRKDFIVHEYQVRQTRAYGADLQLLIVASLSKGQLSDFYHLGKELGLTSLVEVHTEEELAIALELKPEIIGVNCRNLKTLEVDFNNFSRLLPAIPADILAVAESGIKDVAQVSLVKEWGAKAILVGEALVTQSAPGEKIAKLSL